MKTKRFLLLLIIAANFNLPRALAQQVQLTILNVDSFPVLPSLALEGQSYNFTFTVYNMINNQFGTTDTVKIFLANKDSLNNVEEIADTLIPLFQGNDTILIHVSNYQFTSAHYKAGNNIVVVWPRLGNIIGTTYDSLQIDTVYFVPLASINMLNAQNNTFSMFPNPATDIITINKEGEKYIEYVRILNDIGQEILYRRSFKDHLDIRFLTPGFYFIEIKERNGTLSHKKFLKL
jgi:hypothetical protein